MDRVRLKPLPYDLHALRPHISAASVGFHYLKLHAGYVEKLRELIAGKPETALSLESLIQRSDGAIFANAAQIWSHDFYWRSMHPDGGGAPSGTLSLAITSRFGGCERLRSELVEAGMSHFGAGWLWLVLHRGKLQITATHDADLPLRHGDTALFCADLWEHAYYLDYRNEKARYLETFVDRLLNWEFAEANWSTWRQALRACDARVGSSLPTPETRA